MMVLSIINMPIAATTKHSNDAPDEEDSAKCWNIRTICSMKRIYENNMCNRNAKTPRNHETALISIVDALRKRRDAVKCDDRAAQSSREKWRRIQANLCWNNGELLRNVMPCYAVRITGNRIERECISCKILRMKWCEAYQTKSSTKIRTEWNETEWKLKWLSCRRGVRNADIAERYARKYRWPRETIIKALACSEYRHSAIRGEM
jgi:hypothetical protein